MTEWEEISIRTPRNGLVENTWYLPSQSFFNKGRIDVDGLIYEMRLYNINANHGPFGVIVHNQQYYKCKKAYWMPELSLLNTQVLDTQTGDMRAGDMRDLYITIVQEMIDGNIIDSYDKIYVSNITVAEQVVYDIHTFAPSKALIIHYHH